MITAVKPTHEVAGTCLQGYITATREQLATVFGAPGDGDGGYKFFFHWGMQFTESDGTKTIATIYDWKFDRQVGIDEVVEWNIGGNSREAVRLVEDVLCRELGLRVTYTQARSAR
jgi:hypothetical protein